MMCRRKITGAGKYSKTLVIPAGVKTGESATLAVSRLMLVDPRGEVPAAYLLEFLEKKIESKFWRWLKEEKKYELS